MVPIYRAGFTTFIFIIDKKENRTLNINDLDTLFEWFSFDEKIMPLCYHEDLEILTNLENSDQVCGALTIIDFGLDRNIFDIKMKHKKNLISLLQTYSFSNITKSDFVISDGLGLETMVRKSWEETHKALHQLFIEKESQALISKKDEEDEFEG